MNRQYGNTIVTRPYGLEVRGIVVRFQAGAQEIYVLSKTRPILENCAPLGHFAVNSGNSLPTFRDELSGPTFKSQESGLDPWSWDDMLSRNIGKNCHYSLRNGPKERSSHLLRGGSLKTRFNLVLSFRMSEDVLPHDSRFGSEAHPASHSMDNRSWSRKLTTNRRILPKLRMSGAMSPFLHIPSYRFEWQICLYLNLYLYFYKRIKLSVNGDWNRTWREGQDMRLLNSDIRFNIPSGRRFL